HTAFPRDRRPEEEAGSHGESSGWRLDRGTDQVREGTTRQGDLRHGILPRRIDGRRRGDHERQRMAGAPHTVGDAAPEPQELETPTEHRDAGELPTRVRAPDRPARRTVRLPSAHGVQQAHPQDRRKGRRRHSGRRVPSLWKYPKSVRAPPRLDSGANETPDSVSRRGARWIRQAREVSRPHVRLPPIEAGGVMATADPEENDATPTRSAESKRAPKRRGRAQKPAKAPTAVKAPKAKETGEEPPRLAAGNVHVYSLDGDVVKTVELPGVFRSDIRVDLIRRA